MFFPDPKDPNGLPSAPLLIFNSSWPAEECPSNPDYGKYNNFCNEIFRKFTTTLTLSDPSLRKARREEGSTIGNDLQVCQGKRQGTLRWWEKKQEVSGGTSDWNVFQCLWGQHLD